MPACRETAHCDFVRQHMPLGGVFPHKADGLCQLTQGHVILRLFTDGIVQHSGVIPRRRKLQRYRVALPGTDMNITA